MNKALDLRHIEQRGHWYPSQEAGSRSRSRKASTSPVRSENGMSKPVSQKALLR